jgi:hypothetical protein
MASNSILFWKLFIPYRVVDRTNIVQRLITWTGQVQNDPQIHQFITFLNYLQGIVSLSKKELETHWIYNFANTCENCISFQQVVKSKLAVPNKVENKNIKARKTIPKKTREAIWKRDCGDNIAGKCYCCSVGISALGSWHAGHIVAQANGGTDTYDNLRVVCSPCNLAMGVENMEEFKKRCYPAYINSRDADDLGLM